MIRVATDVGGTFTDFVAFDDASGTLVAAKASTSVDIIAGIVECFRKAGTDVAKLAHFVHGSTVAINTVVERKGARTGLLATEGFRHVLDLGRGNIPNSFDLMFETPCPLVPAHLRRAVRERMLSDGTVMTALDEEQARIAIKELADAGLESIGICLLHSYANPAHEQALKTLVGQNHPQLYVTASSDIIRQYREYERTSTTVLNAYVGPKVGAYLRELDGFLRERKFHGTSMIMQSNGGTMTIEAARAQPVRMMESGPVGGTMAAAYIGRQLGYANVVAFDMGGTTAKVSMVKQGEIEVADGYFIGGEETGYPLQLPVVDIIEIGAGGGSIAHLDATGALKIGPASAGAVPGPACYGRGGAQPTVTDADLVLGRLNANYFLGGEIVLDKERAVHAIEEHVGRPLGMDSVNAARGIIKIADISMAHAVQSMTVQRGYDPRESVMVAYGGAGPLHAVSIARELRIKTVVIPPYCGIFSAVGMLLADAKDEYVLSHIQLFNAAAAPEISRLFAAMEDAGSPIMLRAGFTANSIVMQRALEMRYIGQEFSLLIDCPSQSLSPDGVQQIRDRFNQVYAARYGHAFPDVMPEVASLRLHVYGVLAKPELNLRGDANQATNAKPGEYRPVYFDETGFVECAIYRRPGLPVNLVLNGPIVIEEQSSTTLVSPLDTVMADGFGNLIITVGAGAAQTHDPKNGS
jgi:N-methylhydantoinase A